MQVILERFLQLQEKRKMDDRFYLWLRLWSCFITNSRRATDKTTMKAFEKNITILEKHNFEYLDEISNEESERKERGIWQWVGIVMWELSHELCKREKLLAHKVNSILAGKLTQIFRLPKRPLCFVKSTQSKIWVLLLRRKENATLNVRQNQSW